MRYTVRASGSGGRAAHPLIGRLVVRSLAAPVYMPKYHWQDTEPQVALDAFIGMSLLDRHVA